MRGTARYGQDFIVFQSSLKGNNMHNMHRQPHEDIYWKTTNFLKTLGFSNHYRNKESNKRHPALRKMHHECRRKDLVFTFNIYPNGFEIAIGYEKNRLFPSSHNFFPNYHSQFKKPTYQETVLQQYFIKKVAQFIASLDVEMEDTNAKLTPVEKILKKESENKHIHGGAKTLQEIADYIAQKEDPLSYHTLHNARDKNGKTITCGEEKYFYSYLHGSRLCKGQVWHNINNMWWVICNDQLLNLPSFQLFDFDPTLPRRLKLSKQEALKKMKTKLQNFIKASEFLKCHKLQTAIVKLENAGSSANSKGIYALINS